MLQAEPIGQDLMTEEQTAAILLELRRIGVDLATLSEPLTGTGIRASEMVNWLRAIPDDTGVEELLRRLADRARSAANRPIEVRWRVEGPRPAHRLPRERWWPTQSLLDAGTDLMMEEWDPFGVRHAGVDRESVAELVFHFFGPFLAPNGRIDPVTHTTEMIASAERDRLALTPSPEPHRRYLAHRLRELVERLPVPPKEYTPPAGQIHIAVGGKGGPPPLDPEGVCVRCHAFGTVACVTTQTDRPTSVRFCASCWRDVRQEFIREAPEPPTTAAEHIAWLDRAHRPPVSVSSRSWDDILDNVRHIDPMLRRDDAPTGAERAMFLSRIATELAEREHLMDGPMPAEIEAFVNQHRLGSPPSSPSDQRQAAPSDRNQQQAPDA
jgi:hypothetical protein